MTDIETAVRRRREGDFTCVFVDGGREIVSRERGIAPLLKILDDGADLRAYAVADKVVGKAAAMLYARMCVSNLYAETLSVAGKNILERHGISFRYGVLTDVIMNRRGDGICPMEETVKKTDDLDEGIALLRRKAAMMRKEKETVK